MYERITSEDDPDRCQRVMANGAQCRLKVVPGSRFCHAHGGSNVIRAAEREEKRNLQLTRWNDRVRQKADASSIKNLSEEIGILRMLLESQINQCQNEAELLLNQNTIGDIISRVERVVLSCHKLDVSLANLLDRNQVVQFADAIVRIIGDIVTDENQLIEISRRIQSEFETLNNVKQLAE